jgi:hypothetical protein
VRIVPVSTLPWFIILLLLFSSQHIALLSNQIPLTLIALPLSIVYLIGTGATVLDRRLMFLYILCTIAIATSYWVNRNSPEVSSASCLYLIALLAPFTMRSATSPMLRRQSSAAFWDAYRIFMLLTSALCLVQLALRENFVSFRDLVPLTWRVEGFNTTNAIFYGSAFSRPNGFFFYEPSHFSQFLGLAVLAEMGRRRNAIVIVIFLVALLSTLSGTGMIFLATGLAIQAVANRNMSVRHMFLTSLPIVLIVIIGAFVLPDLFAARLGEFSQENSSAYIRFIAPVLYLYDAYTSSIQGLLAGLGPGFATSVRMADVQVDFPGIGKIMYEYGVLGTITVLLLYLQFSSRSIIASWIKWPFLFAQLLLNNGIFTPSLTEFFLLLMMVGEVPPLIRRRVPSTTVHGNSTTDTGATLSHGVVGL